MRTLLEDFLKDQAPETVRQALSPALSDLQRAIDAANRVQIARHGVLVTSATSSNFVASFDRAKGAMTQRYATRSGQLADLERVLYRLNLVSATRVQEVEQGLAAQLFATNPALLELAGIDASLRLYLVRLLRRDLNIDEEAAVSLVPYPQPGQLQQFSGDLMAACGDLRAAIEPLRHLEATLARVLGEAPASRCLTQKDLALAEATPESVAWEKAQQSLRPLTEEARVWLAVCQIILDFGDALVRVCMQCA